MYFSKDKHLLSYSIMAAALIRLCTSSLEGLFRFLLKRGNDLSPDMMDAVIWRFQLAGSVFKIITITVVFYIAWRKLIRYKSLVDSSDRFDMGKLQEEYFGDKLSSLTADSIGQLLQIWAVILIGAECVYTVSTVIYRRFTAELMLLVVSGAQYSSFVTLYNLSHGFKYIEMLTAILLGFFMTGIFLRDNRIMMVTAAIAGIFLLAFGIVQMHTVSLPGREVVIVWTSVIFHLTETVGLFMFSLYLSRKYRGL